MKRIALFLSLSLGLLPLRSWPANLGALVMDAKGKTESRLGKEEWSALKSGATLPQGSRVRTLSNGRLKIRMIEGTDLILAPNTELQISSGGGKRTALQFFGGWIRAVFEPSRDSAKLDVFSTRAVAAVKGTDFSFGGDALNPVVKVYSSHGEGVLFSALQGGLESLLRPGEAGEWNNKGLQLRELGVDDLAELNLRSRDFFSPVDRWPSFNKAPFKRPKPEEKRKLILKIIKDNPALKISQQQAERLADAVANGNVSQALAERILEEQAGGEQGTFSGLAQEQGLAQDFGSLIETAPQPTPQPSGNQPQATPQPQAQPTQEPQGGTSLLQDAQASLQDLQQDLNAQAGQDNVQQHQDLLAGNTFIDRQGYRVEVSNLVRRPDAATIQKLHYSRRTEGPNSGQSLFSHEVTFNQALPQDWTTVFSLGLNAPDNLLSGSPAFYRIREQVAALAPTGCQICMTQTFDAPSQPGGAGSLWRQGVLEQYSVMGLDRGQRHFDALGVLTGGSDIITVTASQENGAWRFDYYNNTLATTMFTARVSLIDREGLLSDPNSFGLGLTALRGFSDPGGDRIFELSFDAPEFLGRSIDVLIPTDSFLESFR